MAGEPVLIYDGDCALCRRVADWLRRRRGAQNLRLMPSQGATGRRFVHEYGLAEKAQETVVLIDAGGVHSQTEAVRFALKKLRGVWPLVARLMRLVPRAWRDRVYAFVSRRRYRLG